MPADRPDQPPQALAPDRQAVFLLPATYMDTWFLTAWRGHIRIALGQASRTDGRDHYRFAIVFGDDDARNFIDEMQEMLNRNVERHAKEAGAFRGVFCYTLLKGVGEKGRGGGIAPGRPGREPARNGRWHEHRRGSA